MFAGAIKQIELHQENRGQPTQDKRKGEWAIHHGDAAVKLLFISTTLKANMCSLSRQNINKPRCPVRSEWIRKTERDTSDTILLM